MKYTCLYLLLEDVEVEQMKVVQILLVAYEEGSLRIVTTWVEAFLDLKEIGRLESMLFHKKME